MKVERVATFARYDQIAQTVNPNSTYQNGGTVYCFDWDNTIPSEHFHNKMAYAKDRNQMHKELVVADNVPNKEELRQLLGDIIASGNNLAITSYSLFPEVMYDKLKEIGLSDSELKKVTIVSGLPKKEEMESLGKTDHMKVACKSFGVNPSQANVVLIDDSKRNIEKAELDRQNRTFGSIQAVYCKDNAKSSEHLAEVRTHLDKQPTLALAMSTDSQSLNGSQEMKMSVDTLETKLPNMDIQNGPLNLRNAVLMDNAEFVSKLLKSNKVSVNSPIDRDGNTLLHICGSKNMAETLLKNGADPIKLNKNGVTPCEMINARSNDLQVRDKNALLKTFEVVYNAEEAIKTAQKIGAQTMESNAKLSQNRDDGPAEEAKQRPELKRTQASRNLRG